MFKNTASLKIQLFAFDTTTGAAKTGDAANITAYVSKDYGAVTVLGDSSATEIDATNAKGWYMFDLTQAETNADALLFTGKSTTANISVVGQLIYTLPASFTSFVTPDNASIVSALGLLNFYLDAGNYSGGQNIIQALDTIKAKTTSLTFTVAGQLDANVQYVNDVQIKGVGTTLNPWNPV